MRTAREWLFLAIVALAVSWYSHAPAEPAARAGYLCTPVRLLTNLAVHLADATAAESGHVLPTPPARASAAARCQGVLTRVFAAPGA